MNLPPALVRDMERKGLVPRGAAPPARPRTPPRVAVATPGGRPRWAVTLVLGCRVVSEANRRDHWTVQRGRAERQAEALTAAAHRAGLTKWLSGCPVPCVVTWTHAGRAMDGDNLQRAFKALRDALARLVGLDDGDPLVRWAYDQRPGPPGVELRIEEGA